MWVWYEKHIHKYFYIPDLSQRRVSGYVHTWGPSTVLAGYQCENILFKVLTTEQNLGPNTRSRPGDLVSRAVK